MTSPDLDQPHPLQACWDLQLSSLGADALNLALECRLFDHLDTFSAAGELAARLELDPANTGYFLELLWGMNLLERDPQHPSHYRNGALAARHLHSGAPTWCGDALLFRQRILRQTGQQLGDLLRNGCTPPPPATEAVRQSWADAARLQIAQEQRAVTTAAACELLETLPELPRVQHILDLGGGPGLIAIALARRLHHASGVVFEFPHAASVAAANIADAGLGERLIAVGGNLDQDDLGSGYDLIWCSSVLHFAGDLPSLLRRLHTALRPGGVLVCCHAEVPAAPEQTSRVLPYYLHLRMQGRHVLAEGKLAQMLREVGFARVEQRNGLHFPVAPVNAVIARKPDNR